jgi:FkbM family methyltransferase
MQAYRKDTLNVGITSLIMSTTMSPTGRIFGFEASEEACRIAQENFALNDLTNRIEVINVLIGEHSGNVIDFFWAHDSGGASIFKGRLGHNYAIKKDTLALDDFCKRTNVKPEFIKIDVEGAEGLVLRGASQLLRTYKPAVVVELHGWQEMTVAVNAKSIVDLIEDVNYKMIYLRTRQQIEDVSILSNRGRTHVLLLPIDGPLPDWLEEFDTSQI